MRKVLGLAILGGGLALPVLVAQPELSGQLRQMAAGIVPAIARVAAPSAATPSPVAGLAPAAGVAPVASGAVGPVGAAAPAPDARSPPLFPAAAALVPGAIAPAGPSAEQPAPAAKAVEAIVPPVRRVMPVTPPEPATVAVKRGKKDRAAPKLAGKVTPPSALGAQGVVPPTATATPPKGNSSKVTASKAAAPKVLKTSKVTALGTPAGICPKGQVRDAKGACQVAAPAGSSPKAAKAAPVVKAPVVVKTPVAKTPVVKAGTVAKTTPAARTAEVPGKAAPATSVPAKPVVPKTE